MTTSSDMAAAAYRDAHQRVLGLTGNKNFAHAAGLDAVVALAEREISNWARKVAEAAGSIAGGGFSLPDTLRFVRTHVERAAYWKAKHDACAAWRAFWRASSTGAEDGELARIEQAASKAENEAGASLERLRALGAQP